LRLPPLAAVRAFEAAARLGSFTRAAAELGMTQAAVSYQIKLLEERVGTPLFLRLPRQVALTDTGKRLSAAVSEAFDALRDAFAAAREESGGVLTISAVHAFASNWLAPRLGRFPLAHPTIAVRLIVSHHYTDFAREEVDVGIRSGQGPWPGLEAHRLLAVRFTPVCSPELLQHAGGVDTPADLLRLPLLSPNDPWWGQWFALAGVAAPALAGRSGIELNMQQMEGSAALGSQGVAIVTPALWQEELRAGRLVQPFDLVGDDGSFYWLVYPKARRQVPKLRAFRDWLLEEAGRFAAGAG
jgi:LysR family glycine cleavage system transcriptional activator